MLADRELARPNRWTLLSLAVTTLIAAIDFATGPSTVLISLLLAGPLLDSVRGTPRTSAAVGGYALALAVLMGIPNNIFGTLDQLVLCSGVAAGGLLAVWAARVRVRAEEVARASEERLRALVENSADGMMLIDREGIVRYASQSTMRLLGYAPAELLGVNGFELMHPDDRERLQDLFQESLETPGLPVEAEYRYRHKDGSWRHLHGVAVNRLEEPSNAAVVVNYKDITAAKQSEERLREYARLLREAQQFNEEVISGAGEGIIVYNRALRHAVWNRFMEELTGLKAERVLGQHPLELFPHLRAQGVYGLLERALAGETLRSADVSYMIPSTGHSGWVSGTYAPHRNAAGEIVGVIGLIRDVTERKRAEEQLKSSEDKYRNIFHFAPIGIYEAKEDGSILAVNRALVRMLGYATAEELIGRSLTEVYLDQEDREAIIGRYEEGGLVRGLEVAWKRKDGNPIWVELHFHAKRDEQLWNRNTEGFVLDVTDRRRAGVTAPSVKEQLARSVRGYLHAGIAFKVEG
jgi:PAS domain S-box-containing protein